MRKSMLYRARTYQEATGFTEPLPPLCSSRSWSLASTIQAQEVQMSGIAQPHPSIRLRGRSSRLIALVLTVLVVGAAVIGVIALTSSDSNSSSVTVPRTSQSGGPNETARGNSAASAAGSSQPTQAGGPNETTRGNAAASASRP